MKGGLPSGALHAIFACMYVGFEARVTSGDTQVLGIDVILRSSWQRTF